MDNSTKKESKMKEKMERQRKKEMIREEKDRVRNSLWYKFESFILTLIFVIILIIVAFFLLKYYLNYKQQELYKEEMSYYYEEGQKLLEKEEYEKAIKMLNKIEKNSNNYNKAQEKINEAIDRFLGNYINTASIYIEQKEYDRALDLFESLPDELKNIESAEIAISEINYQIAQKKILEFDNFYDRILAINRCITDDLDNKSKEKLNDLLDHNISKYEEEMKNNISSKTYEKYSKELDNISKKIDNDKISQLQEFVKEYEPLSLVSLNYKKQEETIEVSSKDKPVEDTKSEKYTNYILINQSNKPKENTITWKIDKEYTKLSGKISLNKNFKNITSKGVKITIYGNGRVIYKSKKIKKGIQPFNFNIDVTGVTEIKIVLESDKGISYFIANPILSK